MDPITALTGVLGAVGGILGSAAGLAGGILAWHQERPVLDQLLAAYVECPDKDDACRSRLRPHIEALEAHSPYGVKIRLDELWAASSHFQRAVARRHILEKM